MGRLGTGGGGMGGGSSTDSFESLTELMMRGEPGELSVSFSSSATVIFDGFFLSGVLLMVATSKRCANVPALVLGGDKSNLC